MKTNAQLSKLTHRLRRSTIVRNAASLYLIQFANLIIPLITMPYLFRVLGPSGYGRVGFIQGLINYLWIAVDYGFSMSATREVSVARGDHAKVNRIVSATWVAQAILAAGSFMILLLLIAVVPKVGQNGFLALVMFGMIIGNVLYPTWFFQGMERMVPSAMINFLIRLISTFAVFAVIKRAGDYAAYGMLLTAGFLITGVTATLYAISRMGLRFVIPTWQEVKTAFIGSWTLFLSISSTSLYTAGNSFILGLLSNTTAVGYYTAAERLLKPVLGLISPITQAVYPRFSRMGATSKTNTLAAGRQLLIFVTTFCLILSVGMFVCAPLAIRLILGARFTASLTVLRIFSVLPLAIGVSGVLGLQLMLPFKKDRAFCIILAGAGLLNLGLAMLLASRWQAAGMAAAVAITEMTVVCSMFYYLWRSGLSPLQPHTQPEITLEAPEGMTLAIDEAAGS